jgi:S1-C subfamily serine protease
MKNAQLKLALVVAVCSSIVASITTSALVARQSSVSAAPAAMMVASPPVRINEPRPTTELMTPDERVNTNVYRTANKSVVYITTIAPTVDMFYRVLPAQGEGSGCILTSDGYILTNNHVVKDAHDVKVTLWDGTTLPAQITGIDPEYDTAVIKVNPTKPLVPIALGDSSQLEVGRRVFAIGAPFGFDHTMTTGIISNTSRTFTSSNGRVIKGVIQTDAAINPGNSGGPLLNTRGEMIGLTTAIYSKLGEGNAQWGGIGFAIPINTIKQIFPQLIVHHRVIRPDLGITKVKPVSGGIMVVAVDPAGPAAEAGVSGIKVAVRQQGPFTIQTIDPDSADVIVKIDDRRVSTVDDLLSYIESKKAGQVVTLTVIRQGKMLKLPVKLTTSGAG